MKIYTTPTQMKLLIWSKVQYIQTYSESHIDTENTSQQEKQQAFEGLGEMKVWQK